MPGDKLNTFIGPHKLLSTASIRLGNTAEEPKVPKTLHCTGSVRGKLFYSNGTLN